MGDWRSEWVRWRGEPGTRQGRALKRGCSGGLGHRLCDGERDATQERELEIGPGKAKGARHGGRTWLACPDQSSPPRRKTAAGHPFAYPPPFLVWPCLGPRNSPATSPYCHRPGPVVELAVCPSQVGGGGQHGGGAEAVFFCVLSILEPQACMQPPLQPLDRADGFGGLLLGLLLGSGSLLLG